MSAEILRRLKHLESIGLSGDAVAVVDQLEDGRWELTCQMANGKCKSGTYETMDEAIEGAKRLRCETVIIIDV